MHRSSRALALAASLLAAAPLLSCRQKGTATARCTNLQTFQSRLGVLNVPRFSLGALLWANGRTRKAGFVTTLAFPDSAKVLSPKADRYESEFQTKLDVSFSADVPGTVKATAETYLNKAATMKVTDLQRTSLRDVAALLDADAAAKAALAGIAQAPGDDVRFLVVSAVQSVSSLELGVQGSSGGGASANVLTFGDFELKVDYQCSAVEAFAGPGVDAFFKVATLARQGQRWAIDTSSEIDLAGYDMTLTGPSTGAR